MKSPKIIESNQEPRVNPKTTASQQFGLRLFWLLQLTIGATGVCFSQSTAGYASVNPFIGTSRSNAVTKWGNEGGAYPGAVAPWSFIQLSPESRSGDSRGYDYSDSSVYLFSCYGHHSGYPGGSAGEIFVMPLGAGEQNGADSFRLGHTGRPFFHQEEMAEPGYYRLRFSDDGTRVEATASERVGVFRFHFPSGVAPRIFIGGMGTITPKTGRVYEGSSHGFTVIQCSEEAAGRQETGGGMILRFNPSPYGDRILELVLSVSMVGLQSAENNMEVLEHSLHGGDFFDRVRADTRMKWIRQLSAVTIQDSGLLNRERKTIFYTALYHSLLLPWIVSDAAGNYRGADWRVHRVLGRREFGGFSPWDTFRSLHPLLCLLFPSEQKEMVQSMLDHYRESGHLPTESMTGDHSIPILVDSWFKGIKGDDSTIVYAAMRKGLLDTPYNKPDRKVYLQEGYIPSDHPESVTRTVEYAYDDWALARFAQDVMHLPADAKLLWNRAHSYRQLFDPEELFLLPRKAGGAGGDPGAGFTREPGTVGYKEGDKWVYSYFVPQDGPGLVNLMGGQAVFTQRLDSALTGGQILFDNETVLHLPYLFNDAGRPDKTQEWVETIMNTRYSTKPGGLPGNDDLGAMSAWYVLSAMGFFPECPGRPYYGIGIPAFGVMSIRVGKEKIFTIRKEGKIPEARFIESLQVNHRPYRRLWIAHSLLVQGGEMDFRMGHSRANEWVEKRPAPFPDETQAASAISVAGWSVTQRRVEPDALFWVRFSLHNQGESGTRVIRMFAFGQEYAHKNCYVAAGATVLDSIPCRLYPIGSISLQLEGGQAITMEVAAPAQVQPLSRQWRIEGLAFQPLIRKGMDQELRFTVRNIGGLAHSFPLPLLLDDSLLRTDTLSLQPGEAKACRVLLPSGQAGWKRLQVGKTKASFKVYDSDTASLLLDLSTAVRAGDSLVTDRSGFSNHGIIRGLEREGDGAGQLRKEGCLGEDGRLLFGDCYIEVPGNPSLDRMGETITLMAWVKPLPGGGSDRGLVDLLSKGDNHVLQWAGAGNLDFFAGGWGRGDCMVTLPADWLGHWHHIAGVCEGVHLTVYIDGVKKGEANVEGPVNLSVPSRWNLGRNEEFPGDRIYHGQIDQVKVFAAPLSGEEIKRIMQSSGKEMGVF